MLVLIYLEDLCSSSRFTEARIALNYKVVIDIYFADEPRRIGYGTQSLGPKPFQYSDVRFGSSSPKTKTVCPHRLEAVSYTHLDVYKRQT